MTSGTPAVEYVRDDAQSSDVLKNGLRQKLTIYPNGRKVHTNYGDDETISDRLSRVTKIKEDSGGSPGNDLISYEYNGTNRLVRTDYPAPDVELRNYNLNTAGTNNYNAFDRFGRTKEVRWWGYTSGSARDAVKYGYDYAGNRQWREDALAAVQSTAVHQDEYYTYDGLHRLKSFDRGNLAGTEPDYTGIASTPGVEQDWTLDPLGNWSGFVVKAAGPTTLNQTRYHNRVNEIDGNSGNSITSSGGTANWADPAYDTAGNMTTMPQPSSPTTSFTLKYDAWNRLVEVKEDGTTVVTTNDYDGLGRRIGRHAPILGHFYYYYNEQWQVLEISYAGDSAPWAQMVWHPHYVDALAIRYYDPETDETVNTEYYCQDANYNVTSVLEPDGDVLERYNYTPYGAVTFLNASFTPLSSQVSAIGNTHLYTGRERDQETGLQLNRHRYSASHLGRWLTRDPDSYTDSANLYEYVSGSPTSANDPLGLRRVPPPQHAPPLVDIFPPVEDGLGTKACKCLSACCRGVAVGLGAIAHVLCTPQTAHAPTIDVPWPPIGTDTPGDDEDPPCCLVGAIRQPNGWKRCIYKCKSTMAGQLIIRDFPAHWDCPAANPLTGMVEGGSASGGTTGPAPHGPSPFPNAAPRCK